MPFFGSSLTTSTKRGTRSTACGKRRSRATPVIQCGPVGYRDDQQDIVLAQPTGTPTARLPAPPDGAWQRPQVPPRKCSRHVCAANLLGGRHKSGSARCRVSQVAGVKPVTVASCASTATDPPVTDVAFAHHMRVVGPARDLTDRSCGHRVALASTIRTSKFGLAGRCPSNPSLGHALDGDRKASSSRTS